MTNKQDLMNDLKMNEKIIYLALFIAFTNYLIINCEPELSKEENIEFQDKTLDKLNAIENKLDSIKSLK